jgi:lipopolysaccharide export system protein LptA
MALPVYHLRRILAATAILLTLVVAGMYFYARSRAINVLKTIPGKIGIDIKQTAHGFQFSKSDGKRTLFTVQASDIKEFKLNGNAELHDVSIVLYGRDSTRFDQIYGDDFSYNQKTGDVTAKGEVQIDLVANPSGLASADQTAPKDLKNPIHLKTRDLVFNRDTGNASTAARVEFQTPQASGWAMGAQYAGKDNLLTLSSQIHVALSGPEAAVIEAEHGTISNDPRQIVLERPHVTRESGTLRAEQATFYLDAQNHVQRALATGEVTADVKGAAKKSSSVANGGDDPQIHGRADQAEFLLAENQDVLRTATLSGHVHFEQTGADSMVGDSGKMVLDFAGRNELKKVHALEGARLQQAAPRASGDPNGNSAPGSFELTSPVIDFDVAEKHVLRHAVTSGAARITILQAQAGASSSPQKTVVTAGKFEADFSSLDGRNHLEKIHGAPDARIVSSSAGQPDRVSTSAAVDAVFLPQGGIDSVGQSGNVVYVEDQHVGKPMQAWANAARYTPADQMLVLRGSPRVASGGMQTTADQIRINRASGDAIAENNVKSTYSELKEQPNGALLASSSPIHVTANTMTARSNSGIALYSGKAMLWQDANVIQAPTVTFDREHRAVTAQGTADQPVQTILIQAEKGAGASGAGKKLASAGGASSTVVLTGQKLTYADSERRVHYDGGVNAKGADFTASAKSLDAFLLPRSQTSTPKSADGPGQLDRMVANGDVVIQQPNRRAEGQKLVYTAAEDKFVLTGGSSGPLPSIFDAEQGKITGVSLTFFRRDDRVLVEGGASTPVVSTTRMAR